MTPANPLPAELSAQLAALSPTQLAWLSGYCWAQSQGAAGGLEVSAAAVAAPARRVLVLSASQTGNARGVAESLHAKLKNAGVEAVLSSASEFKSKTLPDEDIVLLVTSTQGEGEPPEEALPLYKFVFGKKAPDLGKLTFAVLGLGDSSYPNFCQAGKDFDAKFAELGARRLNDLGICDLEFQSAADAWIEAVVPKVAELAVQTAAPTATPAANQIAGTVYTKDKPYTATLSVRQKITSRSAEKDVEHIEIDLSGSGLHYQAGDALGVLPLNDSALVQEILDLHQLSGEEKIRLSDDLETVAIGKGIIRRQGEKTVFIAFGSMVASALAVAEKLNATVADMRFVKPIDEELIVRLAQSHDYIVTAEENAEQGGAGSAVLEVLAKHGICKPVLLLGVADTVTEHGDPKKLLDDLGLSAEAMEKRIRGWLPSA